ncbi:MAG: hypothetical protein AAGA99_25790, partial [Actinomycetota bacterium]
MSELSEDQRQLVERAPNRWWPVVVIVSAVFAVGLTAMRDRDSDVSMSEDAADVARQPETPLPEAMVVVEPPATTSASPVTTSAGSGHPRWRRGRDADHLRGSYVITPFPLGRESGSPMWVVQADAGSTQHLVTRLEDVPLIPGDWPFPLVVADDA